MRQRVIGSFALAIIGALAASPGFAADMAAKAPPSPPAATAYNWTGFYVGLNIGAGEARRSVSFTSNDPASAAVFALGGQPPSTALNESDAIGGLEAGYNWQFSQNWLTGWEADFQWSAMKGSSTTVFGNAITLVAPITSTTSERMPWFGTVRARLGYMPTANLVTYVTGGFAYGRVEENGNYVSAVAFTANVPPFNANCIAGMTCFAGSSSRVAAGLTAGAGLEYAAWQNVTLKAEYLYVSMGSRSITETALSVSVPGRTPASFTANFGRIDFNILRAGMNYRF